MSQMIKGLNKIKKFFKYSEFNIKENDIAILVGSSPLLLLVALYLSKRNIKVYLISKLEEFGGSWSVENIEKDIFVENGCHILESFKDVHNLLKNEFKLDFVPSPEKLKPKTINNKNLLISETRNYHSKFDLINLFLRKVISLCKLKILFILNIHNSKKNKYKSLIFKGYEDLFISFRYRIAQFIFLEPLHIHKKGWSGFINELWSKIITHKIEIINSRVDNIYISKKGVSIYDDQSRSIKGDWLISGESLVAKKIEFKDKKRSFLSNRYFKKYPHLHVKLPNPRFPKGIDLPLYTYFEDNSLIWRTSRINLLDKSYKDFELLIQPRQVLFSKKKILSEFIKKTNIFLKKNLNYDFVYDIEDLILLNIYYPELIDISKGNLLKIGLNNRLLILRSHGCLSTSILSANKYIKWLYILFITH